VKRAPYIIMMKNCKVILKSGRFVEVALSVDAIEQIMIKRFDVNSNIFIKNDKGEIVAAFAGSEIAAIEVINN